MELAEIFYLPAQQPAPSTLTCWQRLLWGMLADVFSVRQRAQRGRTANGIRRQVAQDEAWLAGEDAPIPFEDLCDGLALDPNEVRKQYAALTGRENGHHRAPA